MHRIVCIFGVTGSGKSDLAVHLARRCNGEVISADSMQVYRGLDIGTGKLGVAERGGIPHHLLDCCDPRESFSAGAFQHSADALITEIHGRGRLPIVCGGTGLYFRALLRGLAPVGAPDRGLRDRLRTMAERRGLPAMHRLLMRLDAETARRLPRGDRQRILRALEYCFGAGSPLSDAIAARPFAEERYDAVKIGLALDRRLQRERIARRVDAMLAAGWIGEVKTLLAAGVPGDCHAFRAIGYREIVACIRKEVTPEEAAEHIKTATFQYAKRQQTWFRSERNVCWLDAAFPDSVKRQSEEILTGNSNDRGRN